MAVVADIAEDDLREYVFRPFTWWTQSDVKII